MYIYMGHYIADGKSIRGIVKIGESVDYKARRRTISSRAKIHFVYDVIYEVDTDKVGNLLFESIVRYSISHNTKAIHCGNDHFRNANRRQCISVMHKVVQETAEKLHIEIRRLL